MRSNYLIASVVMTMCVILSSCKSDYTKYVEQELATGISNDSVIFTLELGMTKKEFYDACWKLNAEEKITHGTKNISVQYIIDREEAGKDIKLNFYGAFDEQDIMRGVDYIFNYEGWAPWNEQLQSDSLLVDLKSWFLDQYGGNDWITIPYDDLPTDAHVKIDGNRQVLMYEKSNSEVRAKISDISHKYTKG